MSWMTVRSYVLAILALMIASLEECLVWMMLVSMLVGYCWM